MTHSPTTILVVRRIVGEADRGLAFGRGRGHPVDDDGGGGGGGGGEEENSDGEEDSADTDCKLEWPDRSDEG